MSTNEEAWQAHLATKRSSRQARRSSFDAGFLAGHEAATRTREVTTVAELDALAVGSVVLDRHGYPWLKGTGSWVCTSDGGVIEPHEVAPLTVLYEPEEGR